MVGQSFDEQSARRIVATVLRSEAQRLRNRQPRRRRGRGGGYDRVKGQLVGAMATSDSTHTIDNVTRTKGPSPLDDPSSTTETLTVENADFDWAGDDNAVAYAEYNEVDGKWYLYQVKCPA